jgi:hypothetical protein
MSLLEPLDDVFDAFLLIPPERPVESTMCSIVLGDGLIARSLVDKVGN